MANEYLKDNQPSQILYLQTMKYKNKTNHSGGLKTSVWIKRRIAHTFRAKLPYTLQIDSITLLVPLSIEPSAVWHLSQQLFTTVIQNTQSLILIPYRLFRQNHSLDRQSCKIYSIYINMTKLNPTYRLVCRLYSRCNVDM